jgi:hypothetical protein
MLISEDFECNQDSKVHQYHVDCIIGATGKPVSPWFCQRLLAGNGAPTKRFAKSPRPAAQSAKCPSPSTVLNYGWKADEKQFAGLEIHSGGMVVMGGLPMYPQTRNPPPFGYRRPPISVTACIRISFQSHIDGSQPRLVDYRQRQVPLEPPLEPVLARDE